MLLTDWHPRGLTNRSSQPLARSHDAVIRVYDEAGNVIKTHEHAGDFKEA
jgi:hypothetical protein